jgi:hypothetical protein
MSSKKVYIKDQKAQHIPRNSQFQHQSGTTKEDSYARGIFNKQMYQPIDEGKVCCADCSVLLTHTTKAAAHVTMM